MRRRSVVGTIWDVMKLKPHDAMEMEPAESRRFDGLQASSRRPPIVNVGHAVCCVMSMFLPRLPHGPMRDRFGPSQRDGLPSSPWLVVS